MTLIKLDPERIHILDSNVFTRLYNDLLRAEAGRHGVPQDQIDTTVRDKAPDGGVDCRVSGAGSDPGPWIPADGSVHQLKGGDAPSAAQFAKELIKPESVEAFKRGDAYVFAVAQPLTPRRKRTLLTKINEEYTKRGHPPRGRILTADEIAQWVEEHPGIALRVFGIPFDGWYSVESWERMRQYRNEFISEQPRTDVISEIRAAIAAGDRFVRIVGLAGAGKSRTVMEAVNEPGVRERVLYAPDAANVSSSFVWHLSHQNPSGSGVLVVDECTVEELPHIRDRAGALPPSYTIVAVGPLQFGARGSGVLEIPALSNESLGGIVSSLVPDLPSHVVRAIASRCGGSPKLAVLIGTELARDPARRSNWEAVEHSSDIVEYLNHKIFPLGSDSSDSRVMRAVALFTRLGWRAELADEGRRVVEFLGCEWREARLAADRLIQRGVLSPRGRYLYPTPDILANYLTRETLRVYPADELRDLFTALPEGAQTSFTERLRQLGDQAGTRDIVLEILGDTGFFGGLADLNDPRLARFLHRLVPAFPELTIRQLQRTIGAAHRETLLGLDTGRRHIIWALEELVWWEQHFVVAARLLLRLAWAETETIANSATGVWEGLFQVVLGGTSAPFDMRLQVLDEALGDADPVIRRLGVRALRSALKTEHVMRFGGPPESTGVLPPNEWQPATYPEWDQILIACLDRLNRMLEDDDEAVRREASHTVANRAHEMIRRGLTAKWADVALKLASSPFELRKLVLDVIGWIPTHIVNLTREESIRLKEVEGTLQGETFSDRMRRVVSSWDYEMEAREHEGPNLYDTLAEEGLSKPDLLKAELPWLTSGEAATSWALGKRIGRLDAADALMEMVLAHWEPDVRDDRFLAAYFAGAAERHGVLWMEDVLDQWAQEPTRTLCVASVTWHTLSTDRAAERLRKLIEGGQLPASYLHRMLSGFWTRDISPAALGALMETAARDSSPGAISGRVVLLAQYLSEYPDRLPTLRASVDHALKDGSGVATRAMDTYYWARLARLLLSDDPAFVAQLCIKATSPEAEARRHQLDDEPRKVLEEALTAGGWDIFEKVIGPAILADKRLLWTLTDPFQGRTLLRSLSPDQLVSWTADDPETRLGTIASAIPVADGIHDETAVEEEKVSLTPLARALLIRFGNQQEVLSALTVTLLTGVWWGPESNRLRKLITIFKRWADDPDPNVRDWSLTLVEEHQRRLERVVIEEEER